MVHGGSCCELCHNFFYDIICYKYRWSRGFWFCDVCSNTLTSYIDVISIALNAFACRYISIAFHKGNIEEANKYFNSVIIADTVLSIFIIAIGTPTILNLEHILNISRELVVDVKILFVLTLFRYTITIIGTAFSVGTFITNRISLSERQKSISYLVQGFFLIFYSAYLRQEFGMLE